VIGLESPKYKDCMAFQIYVSKIGKIRIKEDMDGKEKNKDIFS